MTRKLLLRAAILAAFLFCTALVRPPSTHAANVGGLGFDIDTVAGVPQTAVTLRWNGYQWVFYQYSGWFTPYSAGRYYFFRYNLSGWTLVQSVWWSFASNRSFIDLFTWSDYVGLSYP
jgi:hypothetical protein